MSDDSSAHRPLLGDPARQAIPSLRGYAYQMWRTIYRWLRLKPGDTLYLECAEDMDIASAEATTAVQVKDTEIRISLANQDAREAILHFWQLQQRSPGNVRFQFLTRAAIATEQGTLLNRRPGIEVWREAALGNVESCGLLRTFLLDKFASNPNFKSYLEARTSQELIAGLFRPFEWITEEPDARIIQEFIRRRLIQHGEQHNCSPSISAGVIGELYRHCWEVAQRETPEARCLTREDFLFIFEKATSILVPLSALASAMVTAAGAAGSVSLAGFVRFWTEGVPPLPDPILPREQAVAAAVASLSAVAPLVLAGSVGKGKTTLAKLVALAAGKDCLWIDLSGRESPFAEAALADLALSLDDRACPSLVVIDDFLTEPNSPQGVWTGFAMLQRACRNSASQLLITTKGIPRERLDARLISAGVKVQQIEDLYVSEVKEFLEKLGCPTTTSLLWATLTLAQTGGHPKLVHVRALDLRDQSWPNPTFAETPVSIAGQRENERLNVAQRESGPKLDFLYHLTLLTLPFDRDLALTLGSKVEGLSDPGTALDSFLGRWIEPFFASHFRVTSLLTNEATKVWPPARMQDAHGKIFDSFLEKRQIDITHVFSVLMHAYSSQSRARLALYVKGLGLVDGKDAHFPHIARELKLVVHFGRGVGNRAVPFDASFSLLFRCLQFRIATREAPEELLRIAKEWLWELEQLPQNELPHGEEYLRVNKVAWAASVASTTEGDLPPQMIVDAIIAFAEQSALGTLQSLPAAFKSESGFDDHLAILFSFFQVRCRSSEYLDRLLDAMIPVPARLRTRMLAATHLPHFAHYSFIVEGAWIGESKKENPDWTNAIRVLERTKTLAKEWNATGLGLNAAKVLSVVFDEHVNNREAAVAALEDGRKLFGDAPLLDEQLANIHYRHDEPDAALRIWEQSLAVQTNAPSGQVKDPFAFRKAAIAAGNAGDFSRAAELFVVGSRWAHDGEMKHTSSGLLFDAAYAFYKAKKFDQMSLAMRQGLEKLTGQPDPEAEFHHFALQKLAGHVVLWIRNEVTNNDDNPLTEPVLGCCSNPEYDSNIKQLPRTPAELTIAHVIHVEHRLGMALITKTQFAWILQASRIPMVDMELALIDLEQVYRHRRFGDLVAVLDAMKASLERARAQQRIQQKIFEEFRGDVEPEDRIRLGTEYFLLCALTAQLLSGGGADDVIRLWQEDSEKAYSGRYTNAINNLVAAVAATAEGAGYILRNASYDAFSRIVAAHIILVSPPTAPDLSTFAQAAYITWLSQADVKTALREILPVLSASFAKTWEHHLSQTALLSTPRLTVPDIQAALAYQTDGPEKIRQILRGASTATGVRIPPETLKWLQDIRR